MNIETIELMVNEIARLKKENIELKNRNMLYSEIRHAQDNSIKGLLKERAAIEGLRDTNESVNKAVTYWWKKYQPLRKLKSEYLLEKKKVKYSPTCVDLNFKYVSKFIEYIE